ncbi:helix-turn-helix transcriptional regulator [Kocuria flava]|uniref:helix-turn-helix transcriptional regulator n=1 Tax=Kocuria flava TaxID=446860 RepID=UPI002F943409
MTYREHLFEDFCPITVRGQVREASAPLHGGRGETGAQKGHGSLISEVEAPVGQVVRGSSADLLATAELGDVVASVLLGVADVSEVLRVLRRIVPFDAAMLSTYDPVRGAHRRVAQVGYDNRVASFANSDYVSCPSYRATLDSPMPMRMRDYSFDFHDLPTYRDVLRPAGFAEGATAVLRRSGTTVQAGRLVISQRDPAGIDDERRVLLSALAPMLARIVDTHGRMRLLCARSAPSTLTAVITVEGETRPLDTAAARLCHEVPDLVHAALELLGADAVSRSGYVWHDKGWWRVVMTRSEDFSLPQPDVVVVTATPGGPPDALTRRELHVLTLIADGLSNADIAARLGLSVRTVTTHVEHILAKMGRPSRAGCAARTEAEGLRLLG